MMNLWSAIELGKNSIQTHQQVFHVIGHNIANVNTPGYSRQVVDLENVRPSVIGLKDGGRGVNMIDVRSIRDRYIDNQIMERKRFAGKWDTLGGILNSVETLFDESHGLGFSDSLTNFFNAWNDVANHPTDIPTRNSLVAKTQSMAENMNNTFQRLIDEQEISDANMAVMVDEINVILDEVAELNQKIAYSTGANVPANDLLDQRERRLRELSEMIGINVYYDRSNNAATVEVRGAGRPLVAYTSVNHLSVQRNTENSNYYDLYVDQYGVPAYNITTQLEGGKMDALILARDGEVVSGNGTILVPPVSAGGQTTIQFSQAHGLSVGDLVTINNETRSVISITADDTIVVNDFTVAPVVGDAWQHRQGYIPEYKNYLNKLATALIYNVNEQHQQGYGLSDATAPLRDFFQMSPGNVAINNVLTNVPAAGQSTINFVGAHTLSAGDVVTVDGQTALVLTTAANSVVVNAAIGGGGPLNWGYASVQTNATLLSVDANIIANPDEIAASSLPTWDNLNNVPLAVGNNDIALAIAGMIDNQSTVDTDNDGVIDYGTFHEYLHTLHSEIGNAGNTANYESEANSGMLKFLENRRDSISAVSLDEEAATLMQFEKSYQALAQFMGTMSQLTDVLMQIV
jgi:flagellar hook-associated protein 1 FlgK